MYHLLTLCVFLGTVQSQSGPFDVTTIIRLKRAYENDGPADWGSKVREMWPWKSGGSQTQYLPSGTVEVHARTNALGLPLRIGGSVVAPDVEDQVPECSAYGPCDGWDVMRWKREGSSGPAPPIQPQRLDGDPVAVGETVKVRLTTRKNKVGGLSVGMCGEDSCNVVLMKGISKQYELGFDVAIIRSSDLLYGRPGQWAQSGGAPNVSFEEGTVHTIVGWRKTPYLLEIWHEKNRSAAVAGPIEPDRLRLRMFSGLGPTAYLKETEDGRLDGDFIGVGERVRLHLTNYGRVEINFGICSSEACSVIGVEGITKDKRINYKTWMTSQGEVRRSNNPILDSRCISCGTKDGLAKSRTNLFVIQRRSEGEMAVWLEDNPADVVVMPLEPDRDKLKLETFNSVATFIKDVVWASQGADSMMVSPQVTGVSDVLCVSLAFLASNRDSGVTLSVRAANGTDILLATVLPDKANVWRFNRTVVSLPKDLRRTEWRLVLSASMPSADRSVLIQRVGGCNHLDEEDVAVVGETSLPIYVPGYNVSWGAPRQMRAPPSRWCANGGQRDDFGTCVCPPGFRGPTCAEGCGPNRYGADCGGRCSDLGDGCRGMIFCSPGMRCTCAPGFKGEKCDTICDVGEYGSGCTQTCQYCKDGSCDPYTGQCSVDKKLFFDNDCGRPPVTSALTVNGMLTSIDSFPWHGAVYQRHASAKEYKFVCGSALVSPKLLISAAHCFYDHNFNRLYPAERYAVALGKTRSGWDATETGNTHKSKVSTINIPDSYRGLLSNYMGDIAVIELLDPVPESLSIVPACVDPTLTVTPDEPLRVAGWGDEVSALDILEFVNIPYLPNKMCYRRASDTLIKYLTADKFCAIISNDADQRLAKGDSGGGAVVERDGVWYLLGVVSLRQGDSDFTFTNVTFNDHLLWMREMLKLKTR